MGAFAPMARNDVSVKVCREVLGWKQVYNCQRVNPCV
jgi:hypothetical protein